jgi:thiamine-monophosphate kinase
MLEDEIILEIRKILDPHAPVEGLLVANGDDGAVIEADGKMVFSTDLAVEGIHFRREWSSFQDIGAKITTANLADILAMGGVAQFLLLSLVIPEMSMAEIQALAHGMKGEAEKAGAHFIGGDISFGSELVISITAIGKSQTPLTRASAKPGDFLMISSHPGWSAAGLHFLKNPHIEREKLHHRAIAQHRSPKLDYHSLTKVFPYLTSATDLSDGLLIDAANIAEASNVDLEIDSTLLVDRELLSLADYALVEDWVLKGGEDHAILATTKNPEKCEGFIVIGRVRARARDEEGIGAVRVDGKEQARMGYQHQWSSSAESRAED